MESGGAACRNPWPVPGWRLCLSRAPMVELQPDRHARVVCSRQPGLQLPAHGPDLPGGADRRLLGAVRISAKGTPAPRDLLVSRRRTESEWLPEADLDHRPAGGRGWDDRPRELLPWC